MDTQHKSNFDYTKSINEQNLQREKRIILSLIYRDYICTEEQRRKLIQKDKEELEIIEKELREKYNPDNLFKNNTTKTTNTTNTNMELVEIKKVNLWKKIFAWIKSIFRW